MRPPKKFLTVQHRQGCGWALLLLVAVICSQSLAEDDVTSGSLEFFEKEVRPLLAKRCAGCHGTKKQEGGLRVDSRESLLTGGDTGSAIVEGDANSLLLKAVRREGDVQMPPDSSLAKREVRALERWVKLGAPWPHETKQLVSPSDDVAKNHWAFQPVQHPAVPTTENDPWVCTPIDAFVAKKLHEHDLTPSPIANRRTLIRRLTYALTGLPPTFSEVETFVHDDNPQAYERLVQRLLDSPHYGEHWGRHWLDVARYSDTKGYVYAREERFWTHAWTYRDWVVKSLNNDMPYNRFLLLQLAADQVEDRKEDDLAAMGFLTLGRRFLGVRRDVIDDRIDVVCRGTMALTVACARCHDHKYDPIPTADYYSLYGVFDSCMEEQQVLTKQPSDEAFRTELLKRQTALTSKLKQYSDESSQRVRERVPAYLFAQTELHKYPADGFDQIFAKTDLLPAFVRRWERYLRTAQSTNDPVFSHWHAYAALTPETFDVDAAAVTRQLSREKAVVNSLIASAFVTPPTSMRDVCDRYGQVFATVEKQPRASDSSSDSDTEAVRRVLYSEVGPCRVPVGPISHSETFFDSGSLTELWKLQGNVDRWLNSSADVRVALTLIDQATPVNPRVFRRGNPLKLGDDVPRQFLAVVSGRKREPFRLGSGRLELARAIISPDNPLTARVIVNRVWAHHFGRGLVTTPSDFGLRADPPSHPQLLDWLTSDFVKNGWSLKRLHRTIALSNTFQQSSAASGDEDRRARTMRIDPSNRLLWRMNPRRLTFEELRDSLLQATRSLDGRVSGKPQDLFKQPYPTRRTLYGLVDRQYFPSTLRVFDFANPDLHIPQRIETTVPQQALFFINHPFVLERAKALATLSRSEVEPRAAVETMFQYAHQRSPNANEVADALSLLEAVEKTATIKPPATANEWTYGYGKLDESSERIVDFAKLPHFTGDAWQGGAAWPDAKLGWVQLTATGGHPGNRRDHAAVRRWTAPQNMTIAISSHLKHESAAGDGVRAFVVSSMQGILASTKIHKDEEDVSVSEVGVQRGETIDFVVDIDKVLNSDQFLWSATIEEQATEMPTTWNSQTDFPKNPTAKLDAWEQLAHVLLCTNEFLFVD